MLDDYRSEFQVASADVTRFIDEYSLVPQDSKQSHSRNIGKRISDMKDCIAAMEMNSRLLPVAKRSEITTELCKLKEDLSSIKKRWLMCSSTGENVSLEPSNVSSALASKIRMANDQLAETRRIAGETEKIGEGVMKNLSEQRDTIQRTQKNSEKVAQNLSDSNSIASRMSHWWNRFR
ncbi:hypothetical protein IE077_002111 [Cardiosporidium cionae]|uniref:Vesicle transport v-SNARE N-terminal domain-containing protein n=1 Tax=Cardiosporidium cionae TaxID=476202 RepID=A0ABQ7JBJ4_9APIC|nr:hypothetical protein IE077_002111 [Cardiosporidium cionae]|eukprot:KAF8821364.1 hypothetical protein IE077_002111 [Cardiosporidium cionae]